MSSNLYVGNLTFNTTTADLETLFAAHGDVTKQAILVGTNTVIEDNPSLTVRDWTGENPIRIVIDQHEKLSKKHTVFNKDAESILVSKNNIDFSKNVGKQICDLLFIKQINSVIIEGGAKTLQTFIDIHLWDEARVFTAQIKFKKGVKAPKFNGKLISEEKIITDTLKTYKND